MAPTQRILLAAVGLLVVAVLVVLSLEGEGAGDPPAGPFKGLERRRADPRVASPVREGAPTPIDARAPRSALSEPRAPTSWEVRVIDPAGAPLPGARIRATSPDGALLEASGRARWEGTAAGEWRLVVEHADFPTFDGAVRVEAGRSNREIVRLDREISVAGRVIDRFGSPRAGERLWFLRSGERHPQGSDDLGALVSALADSRGRFRAALPQAGPWRVTVGPVGAERLAMGRPQELSHGGPMELEVVLPGATQLSVRCSRVPGPGDEDGSPVTLQVLERAQAPAPESRRGPGGGPGRSPGGELGRGVGPDPPALGKLSAEQRKRLERGLEERGAGVEADTGYVGPPGTVAPPAWLGRATVRPDADGRALFTNLPTRVDLRLALLRPGERHESDLVFHLRPDERTILTLRVPAPLPTQAAHDPAAPLHLPLHLRTEVLGQDERPAGFHWR